MHTDFRSLATITALLTCAVCARAANPIVGTWRTSAVGGANITITLNADGTEDQTIDAPHRFTRMRVLYTAQNGIFTEHFLTGSMNGKPVSGSMQPQSFHYQVTATTLTLSQGRYPVVFHRYAMQ